MKPENACETRTRTDANSRLEQDGAASTTRRTLLGLLAAGAALTAGSGTGAAATVQQEASRATVFAFDYHQGLPFRVAAPLRQDMVHVILGGQLEGEEAIVPKTDDWNGYLIHYQRRGDAAGEFALAFTHKSRLQADRTYVFDGDTGFYDVRANLLGARLSTAEGSD